MEWELQKLENTPDTNITKASIEYWNQKHSKVLKYTVTRLSLVSAPPPKSDRFTMLYGIVDFRRLNPSLQMDCPGDSVCKINRLAQ